MSSPDREAVVPAPVLDALAIWLDAHDTAAPGLIEGLYVVGSVALRDWRPGSDVDIVAFTADPATDEDAVALGHAHAAVAAELDAGIVVDGPILAWGDVTVPPMPVMRPWSLGSEFRHDGDCFEINPVTWLALDRYGIAARGPVAGELDISVDVDEVRSFVRQNTSTYWRGVGDQIAGALDADHDRDEFPAEMTTWSALGVARMLYTWETGDVASKTAAGEWAIEQLPAHVATLERALAIRASSGEVAPDGRDTVAAVSALIADVVGRIAG